MPRFTVTEYVRVRVISELIDAEHAVEAYRKYRTDTDLDRLLRNAIGSKSVSRVEFDDHRESATVDEVDENGNFAETAMELSEEELNDLTKLL